VVGGGRFPALLEVLRRGGSYAVAGAIAGPIVDLDLRTLYLKDLRLLGCTVLEPEVFGNLVRYIERGEIRPLLAGVHPLAAIVQAQQEISGEATHGARSFSFHEFSASQPLQCQLRDRHVLHSHAREVGDADVLRATAPERRVLNDTAEFHEIPRLDQSLLECECGIAVFRTLTHAVDGANLGERQSLGSNSCLPPPSAPTAVM